LQVRVLPGPPAKSAIYHELFRRSGMTAPETAPDTCAFRSPVGSRMAKSVFNYLNARLEKMLKMPCNDFNRLGVVSK
jgi:hypothetical protein